jgi:hypothetical protein
MLAAIVSCKAPTSSGAARLASSLRAAAPTPSSVRRSLWRRANSSPPSLASVSLARTIGRSRSASATSTASPTRCPCRSSTASKPSRSSRWTATRPPYRSARPIAWRSRSSKASRLARRVGGSRSAERAIATSRARRALTSRTATSRSGRPSEPTGPRATSTGTGSVPGRRAHLDRGADRSGELLPRPLASLEQARERSAGQGRGGLAPEPAGHLVGEAYRALAVDDEQRVGCVRPGTRGSSIRAGGRPGPDGGRRGRSRRLSGSSSARRDPLDRATAATDRRRLRSPARPRSRVHRKDPCRSIRNVPIIRRSIVDFP